MKRISVATLVERAIPAGGKRLVRIADMVVHIRNLAPDCEHTDEELAQLIAIVAVNRGCDVSFGRAARFDPG